MLIQKPAYLLFTLLIFVFSSVNADEYQLGHGYKISDKFILGGYFSTEYENKNSEESFKVDDLALLLYGSLSPKLSYMFELESVEFMKSDYKNDTFQSNVVPIVERLYFDYNHSDYLSFRAGKQITPIGYWNLQPINVLRETTSNPLLSRRMFPKFLSGLDIYGYTPFDDDTTYHVFFQGTKDLDNERINIDADSHIGFSLEKYFDNDWQLGGSTGRFTETNDDETYYLLLNSRLDKYKYSISTEAIFDFTETNAGLSENSQSFYVQGEYRFNPKHALISRFEYFHDEQQKQKERISILGYSYRPVYPVSLKLEYQWHADTDSDGVLTSFSVLF